MAEYADPVIDWLDQNRTLIQRRYFRQVTFDFWGYHTHPHGKRQFFFFNSGAQMTREV
jgi:hypothetical protein